MIVIRLSAKLYAGTFMISNKFEENTKPNRGVYIASYGSFMCSSKPHHTAEKINMLKYKVDCLLNVHVANISCIAWRLERVKH